MANLWNFWSYLFSVVSLAPSACSASTFQLASRLNLFSTRTLFDQCPAMTSLRVRASSGQHLNITATRFDVTAPDDALRLRDVMTGNVVAMMTSDARTQTLMTSAGSEVEIEFGRGREANVLLKVEGAKITGLNIHVLLQLRYYTLLVNSLWLWRHDATRWRLDDARR